MPGGGDFVSFFDPGPGGGVFHLKALPGAGTLKEKISGLGEMVTCQIDTCILTF